MLVDVLDVLLVCDVCPWFTHVTCTQSVYSNATQLVLVMSMTNKLIHR